MSFGPFVTQDVYKDLVNAVGSELPAGWKSFALEAEHDDAGLGLSVEFIDSAGRRLEFSPVPSPVFAVVRNLRASMGPNYAWSGMRFDIDEANHCKMHFTYPDSKAG